MSRFWNAFIWTGLSVTWVFGLAVALLLDYMTGLLAIGGLYWLTGNGPASAIVGLPVALLPTVIYVRLTVFGNRVSRNE